MTKETYNQLQKLKDFVLFVSSMEENTIENKLKCETVINRIENIDKPEFQLFFMVCLDIYDENNFSNTYSDFYRRKWWFILEDNVIDILAESLHVGEFGHFGEDYFFNASIYLKEVQNSNIKTEYFMDDTKRFIDDAKNYKSYMNERLSSIEIEISI